MNNTTPWPMTSTGSRSLSKVGGFTLIELLIALVIVSILMAIAIPSYTAHVRHGRRTDARTALLDLAGREERLYAITNNYSALPSDLGYAATGSAFPLTIGSGYYTVTAATAAGPPATFSFTATPVAGKGQDNDTACASFTIDQTGKQSALNSSGADNTAACWTQ